MRDAKGIREELWCIVLEYGKLGLLIDDAPEAPSRIARALYGSEALPRWWRQLRSLDCGTWGLEEFVKIFESPCMGWLRGMLIIDRYIPPSCAKRTKPIPWDQAESKLNDFEMQAAERFRRAAEGLKPMAFQDLGRPGDRPVYYALYLTSFFPMFSGSRDTSKEEDVAAKGRPTWQRRSVETLHEERRSFGQSEHWRGLLRFGPEREPPILRKTAVDRPRDLFVPEQAKWHAETWHKFIDRVAGYLAQEKRSVILLTGAGSSLAPAPTAPGMPATDTLLEEACARFWNRKRRREGSGMAVEGMQCSCDDQASSRSELRFKKGSQAPIDWLIEQSERQGSIAGLRCPLEELFSIDLHRNVPEIFEKFHDAFRNALYRWDYGYALHHWLMARLPWAAIITTNFDGFHERAAAAAATLPWLAAKARQEPLRFANPVTWSGAPRLTRQDSETDQEIRESLFKPYGSLYAPDGKIALSLEEINSYRGRMMSALAKSMGDGPGALVVVGHSMRDPSMWRLLEAMDSMIAGFDLFWVDPESYRRSCEEETVEQAPWERWMRERVTRKGEGGGPVAAPAHEFVCDLWPAYLKKKSDTQRRN